MIIESVWAVLKRGIHGVYHHASPKHLSRYIDEFTFRLNEGKRLAPATFWKEARRLVKLYETENTIPCECAQ